MAKEENTFPSFFYSHQYETEIYQKLEGKDIQNKLQQDKVEIAYLMGKRGRIQDQEYREFMIS